MRPQKKPNNEWLSALNLIFNLELLHDRLLIENVLDFSPLSCYFIKNGVRMRNRAVSTFRFCWRLQILVYHFIHYFLNTVVNFVLFLIDKFLLVLKGGAATCLQRLQW